MENTSGTTINRVENLQANLDALNGDIANVNGEIANISTNLENIDNKVGDINKDVSTLKYNDTNQDRRIQVLENTSGTTINRVEIAEKNITVLNTAYVSYTDYTEVTNGFLLTYLSGKQIELPIKAGTNVTFSKYPGSNQIIINSTGGSVPDNIALLDANNTFSGSNTFSKLTYFNNQIALDINPISFNDDTKNMSLVFNYNGFIKRFVDTGNVYSINIPNKTGTIALTTDIPTLADYPTTIFFNNYNAGIGYKDTSTGTTKTVVSTDNNGAQIVIGDSNTGLTLATNARPKVLEDSTVKEVAYVSDIPNTSSFATLAGNNTWTGDNIFDGFSKVVRVNGLFQISGDEEAVSSTYNQLSYDGLNIAYMIGEEQNIFHFGIDYENKARIGFDKFDGTSYTLYIPEKNGTIATLSDIPNTSSFATLAGNNIWTGQNEFSNGISMYGGSYNTEYTVEGARVTDGDYKANYGGRWIATEYQGQSGTLNIPQGKSGTLALIEDIPTGGSGGDVYTNANNIFTGNNTFNGQVICAKDKGLDIKSGAGTYRFIGLDNDCGITIIKPDLKVYRLVIPDKNGTLSTVEDIPISLMYNSSRLGENSVDFPFNIEKNYFFTITMSSTGESKSFIYARGSSSTYTIVINSSTSFEVKIDATGSSPRLIFTNKSNADLFVVRAEISN